MADDCVEMSSPESTAAVNDSCLSPPRRSKITFHPDDTAARPACEACTVFDKDAIYERIELSDLRSTADAGCRSCIIFCFALDHFGHLGPSYLSLANANNDGLHSCILYSNRGHGEIEFYLQTNEEHEVPDGLPPAVPLSALTSCAVFSAFWGLLRVCSPIDRDPSSTATFAKIQRSLALCDSGHERCASEEGCLPTRVVDVGTSDGQGPCRLYETQRETGDYIALSHCWGRPELIFRTTKETLKSNQLELPWDKLSKTFQDAIHATRRIGKRYLWIDSLCIIQDSDDDWNKESAVMGDIYKNAYLTLGATASSDGAGGLFVERDCHILDIPIPESAPLKNVSLKARRCLLHRSLSAPPHGEPLSSRAWAWQERLLSRRIMHFSSEELIWECKSGTGCECAMQGELDDTKSTFHLVVDVPGWNTQLWRALLESYTQLELTYDKDRLPALSGIASQAFSKSDYLAGLGREFLLGDLCWVTNRRPHEPCRPISRNTGAPSWSWASVNGPVYWRSTIGWTPPKSLELVDASCTPEGENVYGRILHGHLVLRGVVVETNLRPLAESRVNYEAQWHYDRHIESPAGGGLKQGRFFLDCTAIDDTYLSTQPILLLILSYGISTLDVFALVLRRVEVDEVVYERIGVAEFRNVPGEYLDSMAPRVIKIF